MTIDTQFTATSSTTETMSSSTAYDSTLYNPTQPKPPYDPSAPDQMFRPGSVSGDDVLSKSYLWLDWMEKNPSNTNGAEGFLLYMNSLAAAGYFGGPEGNALSNGLLSIQNSAGKTLVAECVDITMEQMILTGGYTSTTAAEAIYDLFDDYDDPVSQAVCNEAAYQGGLDPATGEPNGTTPVMNDSEVKAGGQQGIEDEWYAFMTDPATTGSIDGAKSGLMCAMIDDSNNNVYLALVSLLLLLDAAGMNSLDAYGTLSDELADETDQLNTLITEWDDACENGGFESAEDAQEWMDGLQNLQNEMDATPFDEQTHELIDKQFQTIYDQPALDENGNYYYIDPNNHYLYTVDSDGQPPPDTTVYYTSSVLGMNGYYYDQNGNAVLLEPPLGTTQLTLGDQAYHGSDYDYIQLKFSPTTGGSYPGSIEYGDPDGAHLQTTIQQYQATPIDPDNTDPAHNGGMTIEEQEIDSSLNALISPLSQQTSAVGAEMQQAANWIELVDNTFSATLLDNNTGYAGTMSAINDNLKA